MTKCTTEQRSQIKSMYWTDRRLDTTYRKGRFTLRQIKERLNLDVGLSAVYMIATGER